MAKSPTDTTPTAALPKVTKQALAKYGLVDPVAMNVTEVVLVTRAH